MRWLADECVSARLVTRLRQAGYDVSYAAELVPSMPDSELLGVARRDNRLLLTDDKDFGELVVRRQWRAPGVVLMRIVSEQPEIRWRRLQAVIERFGEGLYGKHIVVDDRRIRFRQIPEK
jgi:predicted nuclease of predicted toxin-antitoxin system